MPDDAKPSIPPRHLADRSAFETVIIHRSGLMRDGLALTLGRSKFNVVERASHFYETDDSSSIDADPRLMIIGASADFAETVDQILLFKQESAERFVAVLAERNELAFDEAALLLNAGASGLLSNTITPEALIKCLEMIMLGELVVSQQFMNVILENISAAASGKIRLFERTNPLAGFIVIPDRLTG